MVEPPSGSNADRRARAHGARVVQAVPGSSPSRRARDRAIDSGSRFEQQVQAHPERIAVKSALLAHLRGAESVGQPGGARLIGGERDRFGTGGDLARSGCPPRRGHPRHSQGGKIYVPLAPSYPLARNQLILDDSQARWIVTDGANLEGGRELAGRRAILDLDTLDARGSTIPIRGSRSRPMPTPISSIRPAPPAAPRGSSRSHRNVLHNIMNFTNDHYINSNDRISGLSSFAFSGSLKDILRVAAQRGALLSAGDRAGRPPRPGALARCEEEISVFSSVSTTFRHFASTLTGRAVPTLRRDPGRQRGSHLEGRRALQGVTSRRGACWSTAMVPPRPARSGSTRSITRLRPSAVPCRSAIRSREWRCCLLDDAGEPVGVNQVGQIAVRSAVPRPGYWRQPGADPRRRSCPTPMEATVAST